MSKFRQRTRGPFDAAAGCIAVLSYDYAHGHRVPRHTHASHQLVYASSGAMSVHTQRSTFIVPPSRAVWLPGGVEHAIDITGSVCMRTLYFARNVWPRAPTVCKVIEVSVLLSALIMTAVARGGLQKRRTRDARLIAVLIDQLAESSPLPLQIALPKDPRAQRVARRVQAEPGARKQLSELARGVGASTRTIERVFQTELGVSFGRWHKQWRLFHGLQRLAAGGQVTSAALDAGYTSVSAFISAFRRHFGVTPGEYLRAQQSPLRGQKKKKARRVSAGLLARQSSSELSRRTGSTRHRGPGTRGRTSRRRG